MRYLTLRVPPPYPDESVTSFMERCASYYEVGQTNLLKMILPDQRRRSVTHDADFAVPSMWVKRLSEAVPRWQDNAAFTSVPAGIAVASRLRTAYCPLCFEQDLEHGRVPHFRIQWALLFVTCCEAHGTPLFNWRWRTPDGHRRLPKTWVVDRVRSPVDEPLFWFLQLDVARNAWLAESRGEDGCGRRQSFSDLLRLQQLTADVSVKANSTGFDAVSLDLFHRACWDIASELAIGPYYTEDATCRSSLDDHWDDDLTDVDGLREGPQTQPGRWVLRGLESMRWRRTYMSTVANVLAGSMRFGTGWSPSQEPRRPWRQVWRDVHHRRQADLGKRELAWRIEKMGEWLDGIGKIHTLGRFEHEGGTPFRTRRRQWCDPERSRLES